MKSHKYDSTIIHHHSDGSHTIYHMGSDGDDTSAVEDHDSLIDNLCDHLDPECVESKLEEHGIDSEKLEEALAPGLHAMMAGVLKD